MPVTLTPAERVEKLTNIVDGLILSLDQEIAKIVEKAKSLTPTSPTRVTLEAVFDDLSAISAKATTARAELVGE